MEHTRRMKREVHYQIRKTIRRTESFVILQELDFQIVKVKISLVTFHCATA